MKKILAVLLTFVLLLGLAACGTTGTTTAAPASTTTQGSNAETTPAGTTAELEMSEKPADQYTIAFALNSADENTEKIKTYLNSEFADALNLKFIFSEQINDVEGVLTFMENAYSSGADAVVNTLPNAHEAGAAKAEELGLYFLTQSSTNYTSVEALKFNLGVIGVSTDLQAQAFSNVAGRILDDGKPHNVVIVSGGAGMGVRSHLETTKSILAMLQQKYNLTFEKAIDELAPVTAITEIATGTDMKITLFPGFGGPTYVTDFSSLIQSGDYDVVLECYAAYQTFAVAIDEVEKAFKMDIKQIAVTNINSTATAAFNTKDSAGSTVLDAAIINPSTVAFGMNVAMLYNALSDHKDVVCPEGKSVQLFITPWEVNNAEEYAKLAQLDASHDTYTVNSDDLKSLLFVYNPNVTQTELVDTLASLTAENLMENKIR